VSENHAIVQAVNRLGDILEDKAQLQLQAEVKSLDNLSRGLKTKLDETDNMYKDVSLKFRILSDRHYRMTNFLDRLMVMSQRGTKYEPGQLVVEITNLLDEVKQIGVEALG